MEEMRRMIVARGGKSPVTSSIPVPSSSSPASSSPQSPDSAWIDNWSKKVDDVISQLDSDLQKGISNREALHCELQLFVQQYEDVSVALYCGYGY